MRMVFGLVLVLGLALAGFAVYMAQGFISNTQAQLAQERAMREKLGPLVEVYIVTKDLGYGDELKPEDVRQIPWPKAALPANAFTDEKVLFPVGAKSRLVLRQMEKFEPILTAKVTEPGEDAGITTRLSKGMRAFAISVDVSSGVSGFLRPDDTVDVYWTGSVSGSDGELTRLIETGIKLVAVDQSASTDNSTGTTIARTVTVQVTPQQVARLAQAQATGRLALSLVGTGDNEEVGAVDVDSKGLLGIEPEQAVVVEEEKVCTVKTRKGADVAEMPIPCTN
ncbi:MAG: Flp pilus assembly protein CpaB [Cereibacter sphaeroides]|uniref:Flp pilus assembly protein CpaB n=1 Tax=Cereibacter sphaeroides TaxID=1063 RepID=A0A2W5SF99_CERSP|nr:MAG: Flp pilus assembly protein CpaB [Cereibacter sphaeroides]